MFCQRKINAPLRIIYQTNWKVVTFPIILFITIQVWLLKSNLIIYTKSGAVRGRKETTFIKHKEYTAFKGIPYAEPPINELRFLPPVPVKPWFEVKDGSHFGQNCIQFATNGEIIGDEDCLFLNIYTPFAYQNESTLLPVMVSIPFGGFTKGHGEDHVYGPDFLIEQDVIVVTFNHRLSVLGFMSLGTPEYSGNMGLKDQQLTLKWIRDNIEYFGGDKDKVTIFGLSSGSLAAHTHVLAESSKGLFQRTIQMSSSFLLSSCFKRQNHLE